jgi:hypothetical protein
VVCRRLQNRPATLVVQRLPSALKSAVGGGDAYAEQDGGFLDGTAEHVAQQEDGSLARGR